ncbi:MAG: sialidase family protein [Armatimonadia bacterium]
MERGYDWRNIRNGYEIPTEHYSDQPYIVKTDDGAWLCTVTTGGGVEGQHGQHVISMRSTDCGRTWSEPVDVEPAEGPEASYAALLKVPSGRIYCFYNHNTDNMREVIADDPPFAGGKCLRVDSLGYHVFKYSDDHGRSWSERRYAIPIREMDIDRRNPYGGKVQFFWNVGKPFIHDGAAYVSVHKVGGFGEGFFTRSEGVLLKSSNLTVENDPEKITWETLPDGDFGLRTPPGGGPVAEEQSYSVLSDGSFYCVYRTVDGHPVEAYSRDGGHTWSTPQYKAFAAGHLMKHPRAANFAWKCENGNYLYWFHNHGGHDYEDRNPVWLCGGIEADGPDGKVIKWTQPEIILYDDDPFVRMSYPDLIEEDGRYFITETQKDTARVHELDRELLEGLWAQFGRAEVVQDGLLLEVRASVPTEVGMPVLPAFLARDGSRADYGTLDLRQGFALDMWLRVETLEPGQVLFDTRDQTGAGVALMTTESGSVEVVLNDGRCEQRWRSDGSTLRVGELQNVVASVDGGPKIITFVIDGILCDGGEERQFGWGRFSPHLRTPQGRSTACLSPAVQGVRVYGRYLRTSEAISNYRAGLEG